MLPKLRTFLFLFLLTIIGGSIRFINITSFRLYPDIYQNLLVAHNIIAYHSVLGRLGELGMEYPDFLAWTRPGYPLLIALISFFTQNPILSAQIISLVLGTMTIPLAFFLLKKIFNSSQIAWCGVILFAFSYTHIVWTGFYLTEGVSVFLTTFLLLSLFSFQSASETIGNWQDVVIGSIFASCILTRYEYSILAVPTVLVIWKSRKTIFRLITIFAASSFCIAVTVSFLFPIREFFSLVALEIPTVSLKVFVTFVLLSLLFFIYTKSKKYLVRIRFSEIAIAALLMMAVYILFVPLVLPQANLFPGIRNFLIHDFLITGSLIVGLVLFFKEKTHMRLLLIIFSGVALLGMAYFTINPRLERYMTHLLSFLLIPGSYGGYMLLQYAKKNKIVFFVLVAIIFGQVVFSGIGMRKINNGTWFQTAYEEETAKKVHTLFPKDKVFLVVSLPEPYYYFTGLSTYSIADRYPYIYISQKLNNQSIVVVEDMGMRDLFPNFANILHNHLMSYRRASFFVHRTYRFAGRAEKETHPVVVYKFPLVTLKEVIISSYSK